jgi:hypothetical protein
MMENKILKLLSCPADSIIKRFTAVTERTTVTNNLVYYGTEKNTAVKSFIM